jgi:hypothetical protein
MKIQKLSLVAAIFLLAAMIPATAVGQSQASSDETQTLRKLVDQMQAQMAKMQAEIDQLKGTKVEAPPSQATTTPAASAPRQNGSIQAAEPPRVGPTSPYVGGATARYQEFSEDTVAAARFNNVPLDPKYHGFFQLPGTQTILKIGGYFNTYFIYDLKPAGNTDSFIPSSFPIPQPIDVNNTTVSIRPTRLSLDFRIPYTSLGEVRFYAEGDFFGSNSTTPRLRHAYAQARNVLIGQTFTNFMDPDAFPDTLDFQGPNGMVSIRNPQFRYGFRLLRICSPYFRGKAQFSVIFKTPQFSSQPEAPLQTAQFACARNSTMALQVAALFRSIRHLSRRLPETIPYWLGHKHLRQGRRDNLIFAVAAGHGISLSQDTSGLGMTRSRLQGRRLIWRLPSGWASYQLWFRGCVPARFILMRVTILTWPPQRLTTTAPTPAPT